MGVQIHQHEDYIWYPQGPDHYGSYRTEEWQIKSPFSDGKIINISPGRDQTLCNRIYFATGIAGVENFVPYQVALYLNRVKVIDPKTNETTVALKPTVECFSEKTDGNPMDLDPFSLMQNKELTSAVQKLLDRNSFDFSIALEFLK